MEPGFEGLDRQDDPGRCREPRPVHAHDLVVHYRAYRPVPGGVLDLVVGLGVLRLQDDELRVLADDVLGGQLGVPGGGVGVDVMAAGDVDNYVLAEACASLGVKFSVAGFPRSIGNFLRQHVDMVLELDHEHLGQEVS